MEELIKKKRLNAIGRAPSQEGDPFLEAADEVIANEEPLDVDAVETEAIDYGEIKENNRDAEIIGRAVAGATPTLFGFLFGPQQSERAIAQTQKFYAAGKPSSLVKIKGEDGRPIYQTPEQAIGEESYEKQAVKKDASGAGGKVNVNLVHRESGKPTIGILDKATGQILESGSSIPLSMQDYAPAIDTLDRYKYTDQYGSESVASLPKFGKEAEAPKKGLTEGIGVKPKIPEYAVKEADDVVKGYISAIKPLDQLDRTIKAAMSNLNASKSDSVAQAAGMFQTAKAVAQEKMTDADRLAVADEASVFARLQGEFSKAVNNEQRQNIVEQMRGILVRMDAINKKAMADYQDRAVQGYSGKDLNKAKYIRDRIVMPREEVKVNKNLTPDQIKALPRAQKIKLLELRRQGKK